MKDVGKRGSKQGLTSSRSIFRLGNWRRQWGVGGLIRKCRNLCKREAQRAWIDVVNFECPYRWRPFCNDGPFSFQSGT
jgi:hypothetical protein